MSTEDYSKKIWDMLDNPQAYSEEEILALLHDNEEAREVYRQIVEVKRSFRQVHAADKSIDVDKAWERFAAEHPVEVKRHRSLYNSWFTGARKYAAIGVTVLMMSGLSYAAIIQIRHRNEIRKEQPAATNSKPATVRQVKTPVEAVDTVQLQPKTFDNVPLEKMLPEIAEHYGMKVRFLSEEVKELRLFFTWNPQESIEKVINKLNQFDRLNVKLSGQDIIVE